jgi:uncharacterized protein YjgD (DUF1641 family)
MAQPIQYTTRPPKIQPDAHEELERLLQNCHRHGVLRFANDLVASNSAVATVLVEGLRNEATLNAIQNLSILAMALSRIPPSDFYRITFAVKDALTALTAGANGNGDTKTHAPGLVGVYRILNDEQLWHGLAPLFEAFKAARASIERPIENPISAFSGKPGRPA